MKDFPVAGKPTITMTSLEPGSSLEMVPSGDDFDLVKPGTSIVVGLLAGCWNFEGDIAPVTACGVPLFVGALTNPDGSLETAVLGRSRAWFSCARFVELVSGEVSGVVSAELDGEFQALVTGVSLRGRF